MVSTTTNRRVARWVRGRGRPSAGVVGWAGQRSRVQLSPGAVGDGQLGCGSGDGDDAAVVQPMVVRQSSTRLLKSRRSTPWKLRDTFPHRLLNLFQGHIQHVAKHRNLRSRQDGNAAVQPQFNDILTVRREHLDSWFDTE